jgi:hypothetical protein
MNDVIKQNPGLVQNMVSAVQNTVPKSQQQAAGPSTDANGRHEMQGPGIDISSLMGNIMMPPQPSMSTTSIPPIDNPMNDEIDIEDDISDIAEPPADISKGNDDGEVREVKVTQTKSKRGGGKKKKSVEINL